MGRKADKRAARVAAARERDQAYFQMGLGDAAPLAHLRTLSEQRLLDVQARALGDIRRPMSANRAVAHVTLGALARLIRERTEARE